MPDGSFLEKRLEWLCCLHLWPFFAGISLAGILDLTKWSLETVQHRFDWSSCRFRFTNCRMLVVSEQCKCSSCFEPAGHSRLGSCTGCCSEGLRDFPQIWFLTKILPGKHLIQFLANTMQEFWNFDLHSCLVIFDAEQVWMLQVTNFQNNQVTVTAKPKFQTLHKDWSFKNPKP